MPDYRKTGSASTRLFRRTASPRRFRLSRRFLPGGLLLNEYTAALPNSSGESLLFFTDTHIQFHMIRNLFAPHTPHSWFGTEWLAKALSEAVELLKPDTLLFGGDLVTNSVCYPAAAEMLAGLKAPNGCFAVPGNWDKRRRTWIPFREIEKLYHRAGWEILVNEAARCGGLGVYGLDDYKIGIPHFYGKASDAPFRLLLSHNPDSVAELLPEELAQFHLALCGHTHGGQLRLPFFGALRTSSQYWKRFEYGCYEMKNSDFSMIVSSGIGATWIPLRINCPPEIILIRY